MTADAPLSSHPLSVLRMRWKLVASFAVLGVVAGVLYGQFAPKWYTATLTVVQSERSNDLALAKLTSALPLALDSMSTDVHRIEAVLRSRSVSDAIIDRFKLEQRYDVAHRELARTELWKHCATSLERKAGIVALTCEDKDPKTAMEMAMFFGEVGNQVFGRVSASAAREERKFLETQVQKARTDVDEVSKRLREFQEAHKVIDLPEQTKATISAMASMQGELLSKELELAYVSGFSARTESGVMQLRQQIGILQSKIRDLEQQAPTGASGSGAGPGSGSRDFFPDAMNVPALRFELEQLIRQQKIQETVFFLLMQRYETAKVNEARDTSTFQILDTPTLPTYKTRPKRVRSALIGFLLAALIGSAIATAPAWLRRSRGVIAP